MNKFNLKNDKLRVGLVAALSLIMTFAILWLASQKKSDLIAQDQNKEVIEGNSEVSGDHLSGYWIPKTNHESSGKHSKLRSNPIKITPEGQVYQWNEEKHIEDLIGHIEDSQFVANESYSENETDEEMDQFVGSHSGKDTDVSSDDVESQAGQKNNKQIVNVYLGEKENLVFDLSQNSKSIRVFQKATPRQTVKLIQKIQEKQKRNKLKQKDLFNRLVGKTWGFQKVVRNYVNGKKKTNFDLDGRLMDIHFNKDQSLSVNGGEIETSFFVTDRSGELFFDSGDENADILFNISGVVQFKPKDRGFIMYKAVKLDEWNQLNQQVYGIEYHFIRSKSMAIRSAQKSVY